MGDTTISWAQKVWNPVRGCSRVSAGCEHCYAERMAHRFAGPGRPYEGLTTIRRGRPGWTGEVRCVPEMLSAPLRWRKPARVFVNSMSDLFNPKVPFEFIAACFGVMAACPQHTFQILTKRPERMVEFYRWVQKREQDGCSLFPFDEPSWRIGQLLAVEAGRHGCRLPSGQKGDPRRQSWPLPNVWVGVSAENQETLESRVHQLLQVPAAVRWVSLEPLLGPVEIRGDIETCGDCDRCIGRRPEECTSRYYLNVLHPDGVNWAVCGAESGPGRRPCKVEWVESIVEQCKQAGVAVHVKQLDINGRVSHDMSEWPEALRIRQYPEVSNV